MTGAEAQRASPDALLALAKKEGRGRLKIFLGAAPGVGKPGDLTTVAPSGDVEAAIRPATADAGASDLEQARLAKELSDAEGWLSATRQRLSDQSFVSKAPAQVVEAARVREAELTEQVARLRKRIGG